jgi:hypothetical protein
MKKKTSFAKLVFYKGRLLSNVYGTIAAPIGMSPFCPHGNEKNELSLLLKIK